MSAVARMHVHEGHQARPHDDERSHHVVVFVLEDMAVVHVAPAEDLEADDDVDHLVWIDADGGFEAQLVVVELVRDAVLGSPAEAHGSARASGRDPVRGLLDCRRVSFEDPECVEVDVDRMRVAGEIEGISFLRSVRQARPTAELMERDLIGAVMGTSDPTLRAVFAEDAAALIGLAIAAVALGAHQLTGSSVPDAVGSILVGVLMAAVATVLVDRNREFLIGEEADPRVRTAAIQALLAEPEVARVTYLRLEFVGPSLVSIIGDVDLTGDGAESNVAVRLRALVAKIDASPAVAGTVLSLSAPDEPSLTG